MKHVHGVDFFQRAALGLNHEKVDDEKQYSAAASEHKAVEVVDIVCDHGAEERDEEVEEPVGGCCKRHADSAVASGVQFSDNSPDEWTPCGRKSRNEQAGEYDHDVTGLRGALRVVVVQLVVADERVDEQAHEHPCSARHHSLPPSDVFDNPQACNGCGNVHCTEDDGSDV